MCRPHGHNTVTPDIMIKYDGYYKSVCNEQLTMFPIFHETYFTCLFCQILSDWHAETTKTVEAHKVSEMIVKAHNCKETKGKDPLQKKRRKQKKIIKTVYRGIVFIFISTMSAQLLQNFIPSSKNSVDPDQLASSEAS